MRFRGPVRVALARTDNGWHEGRRRTAVQQIRHMTRSAIARLALALALVLSAFAPQTMAFARGDAVDLSAYAFPDGSLPVICLGDTEGGTKGDGLATGIVSAAAHAGGGIPHPPATGISPHPLAIGVAAPHGGSPKTPADLGLAAPRGPPVALSA